MVAPPAVISAIEDALRPLGVRIGAVPVTPARLRALIRAAEGKRPGAAAEPAGGRPLPKVAKRRAARPAQPRGNGRAALCASHG